MPFGLSFHSAQSVHKCMTCPAHNHTPQPLHEYNKDLTSIIDKITGRRLPLDVVDIIRAYASSLVLSMEDMSALLRELRAPLVDRWSYCYSGRWTMPCDVAMRFLFKPALIIYCVNGGVFVRYTTKVRTVYGEYTDNMKLHSVSSQYFTTLPWGGHISIFSVDAVKS